MCLLWRLLCVCVVADAVYSWPWAIHYNCYITCCTTTPSEHVHLMSALLQSGNISSLDASQPRRWNPHYHKSPKAVMYHHYDNSLHFSHAHEAAILMSSQTTRGVLKSFLDWWTCWDKLKLTQHFTSNCSNPMCHSPFPNLILRNMFYPRKEVLVVDTFLLEISGTTLSYRRWDHELFTPTSLANT